jgi:hypothetical protein
MITIMFTFLSTIFQRFGCKTASFMTHSLNDPICVLIYSNYGAKKSLQFLEILKVK